MNLLIFLEDSEFAILVAMICFATAVVVALAALAIFFAYLKKHPRGESPNEKQGAPHEQEESAQAEQTQATQAERTDKS